MLTALFLAWLLSHHAHAEGLGEVMTTYAKPHVEKSVADEVRRGPALDALSTMKKDIEALNEEDAKDLRRFEALVRDYASTPADFDRAYAARAAAWRGNADRIWSDRRALLQHLRPEEWAAIVAGARADAERAAAKGHPAPTK